MNFHPIEYAKAHPWAMGIIVVIGGLIFLSVTGIFGGGASSDSGGNSDRPTDAEVQANAAISAAQIQASAALGAASIGASVQTNSDNISGATAKAQIDATREIYLANIAASEDVSKATIGYYTTAAQQATTQQGQVLSALGTIKKKQRGDVLKSLITGQYGYSGPPASVISAGQAGNSVGGIIGSVGGLASSLGSLFSDQRLKENIVLEGSDKNGRNVYSFNYRGSKRRRTGYIAQDIAQQEPHMVHADNDSGYLRIAPELALGTS